MLSAALGASSRRVTKFPRRVATAGRKAVGAIRPDTVIWSSPVVKMASLVSHVKPCSHPVRVALVDKMGVGTVTNRDAMKTNEITIAPSSTKLNSLANMTSERMIGIKRRRRRRGESCDEGAEEKSGGDG